MSMTTISTTCDNKIDKALIAQLNKKINKYILKRPSDKLLTTQYAQEVIAGKIIASKKVKQACRRHLRDLKRQGTKDFPYIFDEKKGHRPVIFIERYCKPSKGNFKQLVMQKWQHFVIGSLYGWVHKDTGLRRFDEGLIFVGRKNGKSAIVSGLALFGASKDGEKGADVYILANSMKQARKTIYEECQKMVRKSPSLRKRFRVLRDAIFYDKAEATIEPQASDSEKLDGLNCHLGLFDEIHEYKHYKLINVVKNSTDAREQPLMLYITTAGYVLDGPLMDYYERGADVLDGVIDDERTFYYMAELDQEDDLEDISAWPKANPNINVSIKLEKMVDSWGKRKNIPAERNDFITKRLNLFVQADEQSFVTFEVIKRNKKFFDLSTLEGHTCIGGFDLSDSEDFTSPCLEFPLDGEYAGYVFLLSHSFIPRKKVELDNENLPYDEWEKLGLLTICPGEYVEYTYVYEWFMEQAKKYVIQKIAYDPKNAYRLNRELIAYGGEEWLAPVRQGFVTLNAPLKDIKELLLGGKVIFNHVNGKPDPLMRWYINNVKLVKDRNDNWMPTKQGTYRKIDGFAAWLTAHTETMKLMADIQTVPDGPGVSFLSKKDLLGR